MNLVRLLLLLATFCDIFIYWFHMKFFLHLQIDQKLSRKHVLKAYILEAAIAVHSIIIGFDYGSLNSDEDLTNLKILFIAFVFHQVRLTLRTFFVVLFFVIVLCVNIPAL